MGTLDCIYEIFHYGNFSDGAKQMDSFLHNPKSYNRVVNETYDVETETETETSESRDRDVGVTRPRRDRDI